MADWVQRLEPFPHRHPIEDACIHCMGSLAIAPKPVVTDIEATIEQAELEELKTIRGMLDRVITRREAKCRSRIS